MTRLPSSSPTSAGAPARQPTPRHRRMMRQRPSALPPRGAGDARPNEGKPMTKPTRAASDLELMEYADGELDEAEIGNRLAHDPEAQSKVESIKQVSELVRGHLELSA